MIIQQYIRHLKLLLWVIGICGASPFFAQSEEQKSALIEQRIEQIAASLAEGEELDYTTLLEDLSFYYEHPLNLNNATVEELRELYLLSDVQILHLQQHIQRYGPLLSMYELQAVESFDISTIRSIENFVTVQPTMTLASGSWKGFWKETTSDWMLRYKRTLETEKGYRFDDKKGETPFAGTPNYLYSRYRIQYRKNLRAGFTLEQDAGEALRKGIDFASFHLMYQGKGWLRKAVLGDYQALFGQGLTFWNGLGFGKSPFVLNGKKNAVGIKPYSSVQEFNYLRGAAITTGWQSMEATVFVSSKKLDGSLELKQDSLFQIEEIITALQISGLHRTASEYANRNTLGEKVMGGNIRWSKRTASIGFTAAHTHYSKPIQPEMSLYQQFRFTGQSNTVMGLDYQAVVRNISFFGEAARSANGGWAMLHGLIASLHPRLSVSVVQRWFERDYQNMHLHVFGENSTTASNERGLFTGIQAALHSQWTLTAYADLVKYPWLRFRVNAPGLFSDYLAQLNYKPDRKHEFYLRYRVRNNEQNSSLNDLQMIYPVPVLQQNWRLHGVYQVHPDVQMKSRVELTRYSKEAKTSDGFLIYQDVTYKKMGARWSISGRYALFDTYDWNSRVYAYETDVLYSYSIPAYAGKGSRFYALIKFDLLPGVDVWLRYARFVYTDRQQISSGNNTIAGNHKSDIHAQLRWQF